MVPELGCSGKAFPDGSFSRGTKTGPRGGTGRAHLLPTLEQGSSGPHTNMEISEGNFCVKHRAVTRHNYGTLYLESYTRQPGYKLMKEIKRYFNK